MSKTYELSYTAERIDEILKEVDEHTIYSNASEQEDGLMSKEDKAKLDALPTGAQIGTSLNTKVDKVEGKGLSENDYTDAEKESVASAYHKPQSGIPKTDLDSSVQTSLDKADTALQSFKETDPTVPSWAKLPNKPSYNYSEIGNTPDLSGFITKSVNDLTNYYLKSETYTKAEVEALIGAIQQFHYEIYPALPKEGQSNVLYLIGPTGSGSDRYAEYVYSNNTWAKIGDTSIDLSGYVTTSALNMALADYTTTSDLTTLLSNKAEKVSNAINGNFAGLDANGNLTDSGSKASDFATVDDSTVASNKTWSSEKVSGILYGGSSGSELPTVVQTESGGGGEPARETGVIAHSGYFKNYTVDLTGAYEAGARAVRFFGVSYTISSEISQGIIATGFDNGAWVVESYMPAVRFQAGYCELPITENSKTLVASVLSSYGREQIINSYAQDPDPSFVPTTVQLLNIEGGVIGELNSLSGRVSSLEQSGAKVFPDTFMPKKVYGVIGDTLQIFRRSIVISNQPYAQYLNFTAAQGKVFERYFEITPEKVNGAVPTDLVIKHQLIADDFSKSDEKTSNLVLADAPSSPQSNINVLCIGASTTAGGQWPSELKRRLTGSGGTPTADGLTNITFVGRKALGAGSTRPVAVNVEATGGWGWKSFYTPTAAIRFSVSGATSIDIGTVYSYTNTDSRLVKVVVQEVNITEGSGDIRCTYASDTVGRWAEGDDTSGTLTRVGNTGGDATITYSSAVSETYCPFYDETNEEPDFTEYADMYCNGNIDVLMAYMGNVNEGIRGDSTEEKIETVIGDMKTLLDTLHADFPNAKVIIGTAALPNAYYGYEYNYSAASQNKSWSMTYGLFRYVKAVEEFLSGDDYKNWCFYAGTTTEVDSENAYPVSTKNANTRSERKDVIGTNGAHPTLEGYQMVADSMYRCFVNTILN